MNLRSFSALSIEIRFGSGPEGRICYLTNTPERQVVIWIRQVKELKVEDHMKINNTTKR